MITTAQPTPDRWSFVPHVFPTSECLSRPYQAYLIRRNLILAHATKVLGDHDSAVQWFNKPARGLDYQKPCKVVVDDQGLQMVSDYLTRIEYGVY